MQNLYFQKLMFPFLHFRNRLTPSNTKVRFFWSKCLIVSPNLMKHSLIVDCVVHEPIKRHKTSWSKDKVNVEWAFLISIPKDFGYYAYWFSITIINKTLKNTLWAYDYCAKICNQKFKWKKKINLEKSIMK